jgi:hypothetical protein
MYATLWLLRGGLTAASVGLAIGAEAISGVASAGAGAVINGPVARAKANTSVLTLLHFARNERPESRTFMTPHPLALALSTGHQRDTI